VHGAKPWPKEALWLGQNQLTSDLRPAEENQLPLPGMNADACCTTADDRQTPLPSRQWQGAS